VDAFRALSKEEQFDYMRALSQMEAKLPPDGMIGFALFKMWVGAVAAGDEGLIREFSRGLEPLSRKGDLG
jgi:hypothetical protein